MENGKSMLYRNKSEYLKQRKTASASKKKSGMKSTLTQTILIYGMVDFPTRLGFSKKMSL